MNSNTEGDAGEGQCDAPRTYFPAFAAEPEDDDEFLFGEQCNNAMRARVCV